MIIKSLLNPSKASLGVIMLERINTTKSAMVTTSTENFSVEKSTRATISNPITKAISILYISKNRTKYNQRETEFIARTEYLSHDLIEPGL